MPLLAVCFAVLFERVALQKEVVKNKVFGFSFQIHPFFEPLFRFKNVFLLVLVMIIGSMGAYALGFGMPNDSTWKAISFSMQKNVSVQNDWWLGHWIYYAGGVPSSEFGPPTVPFVCDERMVLTKEELKEPFFLEKSFGDLRVYSCKVSGS